MKTRLKHMTAALLTLIMVIGMVPLNAFAWGTEGGSVLLKVRKRVCGV